MYTDIVPFEDDSNFHRVDARSLIKFVGVCVLLGWSADSLSLAPVHHNEVAIWISSTRVRKKDSNARRCRLGKQLILQYFQFLSGRFARFMQLKPSCDVLAYFFGAGVL